MPGKSQPRRASRKTPPNWELRGDASSRGGFASYKGWKTKKIWLLGAVGKSGKLIKVIGALGPKGRAAPPDLGKILIRYWKEQKLRVKNA